MRAAADRHHDGHRRSESQCARASDDQHGDRGDKRVRKTRLRPEKYPDQESDRGGGDDRGHEVGSDSIGQTLHWCAAALGFADELHDLGEHGFVADALGYHDEAAAGVERASGDLVTFGFLGGHRFAGQHRFVDCAGAFDDHAIDGHVLTGPYAQLVAGFDLIQCHVLFATVRSDKVRLLRGEIQQCANCAGGLLAGSQFQHLAQQDERGDHGCGFKIHRRAAIHPAKGDWKHLREYRGHYAFEIRGSGAEANQREHIGAAVNQRIPETAKEGPAAPQDDRGRENEFDPVAKGWSEMQTEVFAEHGENEER